MALNVELDKLSTELDNLSNLVGGATVHPDSPRDGQVHFSEGLNSDSSGAQLIDEYLRNVRDMIEKLSEKKHQVAE